MSNSGGPEGGGVPSPDGRLRAYALVASSDRYDYGDCRDKKVKIWLTDTATRQSLNEKKFDVNGCMVSWAIKWRDTTTAEFELFDYGPKVKNFVEAKNAAPELRRSLTKQIMSNPITK